jgi:hypothetical protein
MFSSATKPKLQNNVDDRRSSPARQSPRASAKKTAPSTPSLRDMITKAVADLREPHGSTVGSIFNYVSSKLMPSYLATPTKMNAELQRSVEAGLLATEPRKLLCSGCACLALPFLSLPSLYTGLLAFRFIGQFLSCAMRAC